MDVVLEPGCPNRRAHPRWIQHRAHLRDAVVSRSRPQAPPANVTETYKSERRRTYRKKAYLGVTRRRYTPADYGSSRVKSGPLRGPIDPRNRRCGVRGPQFDSSASSWTYPSTAGKAVQNTKAEARFRAPAYLPDRPERPAPCRGPASDVTLRRP